MQPLEYSKLLLTEVKNENKDSVERLVTFFTGENKDIPIIDVLKKYYKKENIPVEIFSHDILKGFFSGGKSKGYLPKNVDIDELKRGLYVEQEHSDNLFVRLKIAIDHLTEDPKYYTNLAKVEKD